MLAGSTALAAPAAGQTVPIRDEKAIESPDTVTPGELEPPAKIERPFEAGPAAPLPGPPPAAVPGARSSATFTGTVAGEPMRAGPNWDLPPLPSWGRAWRDQFRAPGGPPPLPDIPPLGATPARLTIREAVAAALQNNPGLIAQSLTPIVQQQGILGAEARFDPIFAAETDYNHTVTPATSALSGAQTVDISNFNWNFYAHKGLITGANLDVQFLNNRFKSNSDFQGLSPQYQPIPSVTLNQPLLRDFGLYFTRLRIDIAEVATDAAIEDYRAAVADFITRVIRGYWDVVLTNEVLRVRQDSLALAQQTVRDNRTRVDVGVLPPVAVKESEAEAARREEEVIVAENQSFQAKRVLQQLVFLPGFNEWLPRAIDPVDRPSTERVDLNPEASLQTAVTQRGEIRSARLNVQANDLNVKITENQLMPRFDVFGTYGVNSLSGDPTRANDPLNFRSIYGGTYGDALGRLISNNFYTYAGGVRLEVPLANAAADAAAQQSRVQREQAMGTYRQRVSDVLLEVGQSLGDVSSNMKRIDASRVARELAEENLANQTRRYEVGMVTTTDLIRFQNEVSNARLVEIQAVIDYNNSITALERAEGTLLDRFNVEVAQRRATATPWWARF
ncbi:MAG TPA: TolC family protein [Candidatus Binatia bacterium]|nr:TolC family protein [Candidatus Binatia bacterium]